MPESRGVDGTADRRSGHRAGPHELPLVEPEDAPALLREEVPGEAFTPERRLLALEPVVAIEPLDRAPGALFALTERGQKVGLPRREMALDRVLLPERMLHRARSPRRR